MIDTDELTTGASLENKQIFGTYAAANVIKWRELIGQKIIHKLYDEGKIVDLQRSPQFHEDCLYIEFPHETRHFKIAKFTNDPYVLALSLSPETIKRIQQEAQEAAQKRAEIQRKEEERLAALRAEMERKEQERLQALRDEEERKAQLRLAQQQEAARKAHQRTQAIQQVCSERNVRTLTHFTRLQNLPSILEHGLLPRSVLEAQGYHNTTFNDLSRFDDRRDAVCLSVSFPNYQMFYRFRNQIREPWIVLCIDARALWELDCAFCRENAASNDIRRIPIEQRKMASSFAEMFSDCASSSYTIHRNHLNLPNHYPTHPQAEVLVFGRIDPSYFQAIHFADPASRNQYRVQLVTTYKDVVPTLSTTFFQPRQDWQFWKGTRQGLADSGQPEILEDDDLPF